MLAHTMKLIPLWSSTGAEDSLYEEVVPSSSDKYAVKTHINIVCKPARKVYFITNVQAYIIKGLGPLHVVVTRYNPSYMRHQI